MLLEHSHFLCHRAGDQRNRSTRSNRNTRSSRSNRSIQILFHFSEEPGIAERSPTDHNRINSVAVEALACALRRTHVPVTYNRYMHARVVFDFAYQRPVGFSAVHLASCTTVDSQFLNTAVLQGFRQRKDERFFGIGDC